MVGKAHHYFLLFKGNHMLNEECELLYGAPKLKTLFKTM